MAPLSNDDTNLALVSQTAGRILVSDRAHLLFDLHKEVDGAREAELAVRGMLYS